MNIKNTTKRTLKSSSVLRVTFLLYDLVRDLSNGTFCTWCPVLSLPYERF